jgi:protein phosphatase
MTTDQYSNKGRRKTNQDVLLYKNTTEKPQIFICADGMGGYSHGEVASRVVSESILEFIEDNYHIYKPEQLIKEAVIYGNDSLMLKKLALGVGKMGTVITILMITGNTAYVSWLGDSRIYQYRNSQEIYRTEDHSIANELYKIHTLTAVDVEKYASIVTASVMGDDTLKEIPVQKLDVQENDIFILCTDGLHKEVGLNHALAYTESKKEDLDKLSGSISDNYSFIKVEI